MSDFGFPILYALGLWWFSTGVVLYLDNLPGRTFRWTLFGGVGVLAVAIFGLVASSAYQGILTNYVAFTSGVVIWGVLEMSYFTGYAAGPRRAPCPADCRGWRRFGLAIMTSLYHELAIMTTGLLLMGMTWGEPNQVGAWTFVVLWLMRWSAKMNLFLGVPNLNENWLPEHLRYLKTYMSRRGMNLLFPVSVTLATVFVVMMALAAAAAETPGAESVGLTLVATLLALAILEHWFLVLPLPDEALWAWAMPPREGAGPRDLHQPPRGADTGQARASPAYRALPSQVRSATIKKRHRSERFRFGVTPIV